MNAAFELEVNLTVSESQSKILLVLLSVGKLFHRTAPL